MEGLPPLKIGPAGVRGIAGRTLTPRLAASFGAAFGTCGGRGPVMIGTDTRPSREMVTQAVVSGLLSTGCTPIVLGIVPLPAMQFYVGRAGAAGGIYVSASHNPAEWNALKFLGSDGALLRPNRFAELLDLYHQGTYARVPSEEIPEIQVRGRAIAEHRRRIVEAVAIETIRKRAFRVAVDCCNGAASQAAPEFLRELGCSVIEVFTDADRPFARDPEPVAANLGELCRAVRAAGADAGFALDADADRLALVDERGTPLGEDCTVALAIDHVLGRAPSPVVVNLSTSRLVDDVAARHGVPVFRTRVGEIHVLERMQACGAAVGGEGNGSVIVPALNPCRDGFVAMALVLESLAQSGTPLSGWRRQWPDHFLIKQRIPCRQRDVARILRLVRRLYREYEQDLTDGVLVKRPDGWLHVRGSLTEPVVRVIAEGPTERDTRALLRPLAQYLLTGEV